MNRKSFLKSLLAVPALLSSSVTASLLPQKEKELPILTLGNGSMMGFKTDPIKKVRVGMIGLGNRGKVLTEMFYWLLENDLAEVVALCDLSEKNIQIVLDKLKDRQKTVPNTYFKDENDWQNLARREDIDLLLICTPWRWHTPMATYGMEQGRHVAVEVPIAYTLEDCQKIVETAEQTKRHCIMLENCCYNEEELFVLNMVQKGVFGDLTHAEGAYLHDLRAHMLSQDYYQGQWRLMHHIDRDGNFYTTHGLGPVSLYMNIGRGDTFSHLTSMSSRELNLSLAAQKHGSEHTRFTCGDINTTLIKTEAGKTIMLQFDVHTGRPYSRINKLVGTKAVHDGYPSRLYIDDPENLVFWGHNWLSEDAYQGYREKYKHPMIKKLENISRNFKQGHGGMDFVMIYRLISCLNQGLPLDLNVYDGVMWSAITPLSEISVAENSRSVPFPDFTGGKWKEKSSLEIMRAV